MRFSCKPQLIGLLLLLKVPHVYGEQPTVYNVWPGNAPDENAEIGPERVRMSPGGDRKQVEVTEPTRMITGVSTPTVSIYRPDKPDASATAVIICPGGGYWDLYWELEGEEVASWLNTNGITAIILKYRVPRRPDEPTGEPARRPLQDAQRAVSLIRSRAQEFQIHPQHIGIMGFSAGGHLAISTATMFERRSYKPIDEVDEVSCRPDFAVPVYSGYLRSKDSYQLASGLSVPKETPPMFLVHGGEDLVSSADGSVLMYQALLNARVHAELHVYAGTSHDVGVRQTNRPYSSWTTLCLEWMKNQGFLSVAERH